VTASEWDETRSRMFPLSSAMSRSEEALPSLTATVEVVALLQFLEPVACLAIIAERNRPAPSVAAQEFETGRSAAILIPEGLSSSFGSD
jgi:hypothetical protein